MKKIFMTLLFSGLLLGNNYIFSIIDAGAQVSYISITEKTDNSTSTVQAEGGYLYGVFAHLTYGIPGIGTIGAGPYLELGKANQSTNDPNATVTKENLLRIGGEIKLELNMVPVINPYAMVGLGYHNGTMSGTMPMGSNTIGLDLAVNGFSYQGVIGASYKVSAPINIFVEAGFIGGNVTIATKNITLNGSPLMTLVIPDEKGTFTAYRIGFGVSCQL